MAYLITAALPYANGPLHIGHLAGCYIPADIYSRFLRLKGEDVIFVCGSDEHGIPITIKAKELNKSPQEVVDKYHEMMKNSFKEFGISFDIYSRTSSEIHHRAAQDFFKTLYNKNVFEENISDQFYDEEAKQFLADRYITGTCPNCGNPDAYGDQCENCGSSLQPFDLLNPKSKLSGSKPVLKKTQNWYLPLDKYENKIKAWITSHRNDWKTNVIGQCMSWLNEGLKPRAMTRDLNWGVKVPLPGAEGKVLYVWFDAPIGYISATMEYCASLDSSQGKPKRWEDYWKNPDTKLVHFIGKDNIVFHCIIFPAMLMAHGDYVLPVNVPANEFLNLEGQKISTSRNHAVWLHEYLNDFPGRRDELRYVLTSIAPETKDADFTWKDYQQKVNSELVAIFGNYVNRVMVLTWKYFDGQMPSEKEIPPSTEKRKKVLASYFKAHEELNIAIKEMINALKDYRFREAQFQMINLSRIGNKFLAETEPWKLAQEDMEAVAAILNYALTVAGNIAIACEPFLPDASAAIHHQLNSEPFKIKRKTFWETEELISPIPEFHQLNKPALLYKNIEDAEIEKQIIKLQDMHKTPGNVKDENTEAATNKNSSEIAKAQISYDEFTKMDLRTATILEASRVPKTDKLLELKIDLGYEQRTIVSGIAHCYQPENIVGRQITIIANLAPRKIKGIESKGMILMAEDSKGKLSFVSPAEGLENGSVVK